MTTLTNDVLTTRGLNLSRTGNLDHPEFLRYIPGIFLESPAYILRFAVIPNEVSEAILNTNKRIIYWQPFLHRVYPLFHWLIMG